MIERFVLPERQTRAAEDAIGDTRRSPLSPPHDGGHRCLGLQQQMNMIRHDNPGVPIIELLDLLSIMKRPQYHFGDTRISQPHGTTIRSVMGTLHSDAAGVFSSEDVWLDGRWRSCEAPSYQDDGLFRIPMRESTSIEAVHDYQAKRQTTKNDGLPHGLLKGTRHEVSRCRFHQRR